MDFYNKSGKYVGSFSSKGLFYNREENNKNKKLLKENQIYYFIAGLLIGLVIGGCL